MKKLIVILSLSAILTLQLCACGSAGTSVDSSVTAEVPTFVEETATPPVSQDLQETLQQETSEERKTAESCINKPLTELTGKIGEPESAEYSSSCLGNGEDGYLYYSDFIVVTYREGSSEVIQDVLDPDMG